MNTRTDHPANVPCWVETLQPEPERAAEFYAALFDWDLVPAPGDDPENAYVLARYHGADAAGIAPLPNGLAPGWYMHIRVDNVDEALSVISNAGGRIIDGPLDAAPAGRLGVVADPDGAVFCVWEPAARTGAQTANEPGAWVMSSLITANPDRGSRFYQAAFGWNAQANGAMTLFRLPGYIGGVPEQPVPRDVVAVMVATGNERDTGAQWTNDFRVTDAESVTRKAEELGGRILEGPSQQGDFIHATLVDPAGALFTISQLTLSKED